MQMRYCVCTEQADGYGYSMCIIEEFDSREDAIGYLNSTTGLYADYYYIKEIWFNN